MSEKTEPENLFCHNEKYIPHEKGEDMNKYNTQ